MKAAGPFVITMLLAGCGAAASQAPSAAPTASQSQAEATPSETPSAAPSSSQVEAGGVFVFTPGIMDCPGGCPSYSVAEALVEPGQVGIPILVDGHVLIEPDGSVWYCKTLTESEPPQCGGQRLEFDGVDLMDPATFEELDGVRWSEQVQLLGEVRP